jgi:hypothetical protein
VADDTSLDDDPALPGSSSLCSPALERVGDFLAAPDPTARALARRTTMPACPAQLGRGRRPAVRLCCRAKNLADKTPSTRSRAASAIADKADNPFWSNHVAAWYRGTLEAETYRWKQDLSTTRLMRWARHLLSAEDLRERADHLRDLPQKASKRQQKKKPLKRQKEASAQSRRRSTRTAVRLLFRRSRAYMSKR